MNSDVGGQLKYIITADIDSFSQKLGEASNALDSLAKEIKSGSAEAGEKLAENIASGADKATQSLNKLKSSSTSALKGLVSGFAKLGTGALLGGLTAATGAMTSLATKGMSVGSSLESNRLAFDALTGSVEKAEYVLKNVAEFAQENPFQMLDVSNTAKELVAMGRQAAQIPGDLQKIGAVAVGTGADLSALGHVYAQISAQGKMMTQDMYQLVNQGVAILPALEKVTGKAGQELRDFISDGKVTMEVFEEALGKVVDPDKYEELLEKMNNTIPRQLDRLKGSITTFATNLVGIDKFTGQKLETGLAQTYTNILKKLADALRNPELMEAVQRFGTTLAKMVDKIVPLLDKLAPMLTKVFDFLADHMQLLLPILGGVLVVLGKLGGQIPVLGGVINGITGSLGGLKTSIVQLVSKNPLLAAGLAILVGGFIAAYKSSEDFRNAISSLFQSVAKIAKKLLPAFQQIGQAFVSLVASPAVIQILTTLANVLAGVADAIASLPTGLFTQFITMLITLTAINKNKFLGIGGGILYIITSVQQLAKLTDNFKDLPRILGNIGHNMMTGLLNGIIKGAQAVMQFVQDLANSIVATFRSILGIHSPSKVMRQLGQYTTLGLAKGITDKESAVQLAMDNLASDILDKYETIMDDMNDFGMIPDFNTEYNYWKEILKNFTEGSEQYLAVLDKMKAVRKQINQQIVDLAKEYNDNLDSTVKQIANSYKAFDVVNRTKPSDIIFPENILRNTQRQVENMEAWAEAQDKIRQSPLDPKLIEELGSYGVDSLYDLQAIAEMTDDQLEEFNKMWLRKQEIAEDQGVKQLAGAKDDTLEQIANLSKGLEGQVSSVAEEGGRLVTNFGDNMVEALPTLDDAFSQWDNYLADAAADLAKKKSGSGSSASASGAGLDAALDEALGNLKTNTADELQGIEGSVEEMAENLVMGIAGVIGALALSKFAPKIAGALGGWLGKLFKHKSIADAAGGAAQEGTNTIVQSFSGTINQAAPEMTKGQKVLKTIREGLIDLILLAGVIAAFAAALWVVNQLIPDDLSALIPKIALVGGVMLAFGALAGLAGALDKVVDLKKSILIMAGLAGDIALLAAALWVVNTLIPDDFSNLVGKIVMVGVVAAAFAVLAGVMGIAPIAAAISVGLILLAGLALDIALLAGSLALVDALLPDDFSGLINKIKGMNECLHAMVEDTNLGTIIGAFVGLIDRSIMVAVGAIYVAMATELALINAIAPNDTEGLISKIRAMKEVMKVMTEDTDLGSIIGAFVALVDAAVVAQVVGLYAVMAVELKIIETIDLDTEKIKEKVQTIKDCMEIVSANDDRSVFDIFKGVIKEFLNVVDVALASQTVGIYAKIAQDLNKIQNIELDYGSIEAKIQVLKSIVDYVCGTGTGSVSEFLSKAFGAFLENFKTDQAAQVINTYTEMIEDLNKIQDADIKVDTIKEKLAILKQVVQLVTDTGDDGIFKLLAEAIKSSLVADSAENASKIFQAYSTIADAIDNIKNKIPADMTEVNTRIKNIEDVIGKLRDADLSLDNAEDKEYRIGMATSMLYKFGEAGNAVNTIGALNDGWRDNIVNIRDALYEVGEVYQTQDIEDKEYRVGILQSIINKFSEIAPVLNSIETVDASVKQNLINIRDCLYEVGQLNETDNLDNKIAVAEKSVTLLRHLAEFSQVANTVVTVEQGTFDVITRICQVINDSITKLVSDLNAQLPNFVQIGTNMAENIQKGWQSVNLETYLDKQAVSMLSKFSNYVSKYETVGAGYASMIKNGFIEKKLPEAFESYGRQTTTGFANGLSKEVWRINIALGQLSQTAINKMKSLLGIASPSKVFFKLGEYTGEGFALGLESQVKSVSEAAEEIADAIRSPFEGIEDLTATVTGSAGNNTIGTGRSTTINQNNIINTNLDYNTMMADLKWELFTA